MSLDSLSHSDTPDNNFAAYQKNGGRLTAEEYGHVINAHYSEDDYKKAMSAILPLGISDHTFVEMTAKVMMTLGDADERVQHIRGKLIPEVYILLGRH